MLKLVPVLAKFVQHLENLHVILQVTVILNDFVRI